MTPDEIRLARYVALNKESTRLIDREDIEDNAEEKARIDAESMNHFLDIIESEDWFLVDHNDQRHPILGPIFRNDDEIVWRWNPQRMGASP